MKITLTHSDLNRAIANYARDELGLSADLAVSSVFSLAGKQRDVVTAEVTLEKPSAVAAPAAEVAPQEGSVFGQ